MIICIPAHNEQNNIGGLVARCKRLYPEAEVVVVDDGSEDFTAMDAKLAGATVLQNGPGAQYRDGFVAGMAYAIYHNTDRIVYMDAGNSYDPADLRPLLHGGYEAGAAYRILHNPFSIIARAVFQRIGGFGDYTSMRTFRPSQRWIDFALRCDRKAHDFNPQFAYLLNRKGWMAPVSIASYRRTNSNLRPWQLPGIATRFALFVLRERLHGNS